MPDLDFLEQCLTDHREYPFKVVFLHQPPNLLDHYSPVAHWAFRHHEPRYPRLLTDHQVKLVCSAHITAYDRYMQGDVHFLVSGGGGYTRLCYGPPIDELPPYRGNFFHFVQITVDEAAHFSGRVYRAGHSTQDMARYRFSDDLARHRIDIS